MLHYSISGNGHETLVLLHGYLENSNIWEEMEKFLSKNFTLVKIDLPGHGQSKKLGEIQTMEMMAVEIKKVLDHLHLSNIHLLGHSMGGYITLAFAEKHPEYLKTFTLFFSTFLPDDDEKKDIRTKSFRIVKEAFSHYVNAGIANLFNPNELDMLEGKIELAKKIALTTDNLGALACLKGMIERPNRKKVLENFNGKILLILGNHDTAVKTNLTVKNLPDRTNIKSYVLDCGHNGHWERSSICAEIINTELMHNFPGRWAL